MKLTASSQLFKNSSISGRLNLSAMSLLRVSEPLSRFLWASRSCLAERSPGPPLTTASDREAPAMAEAEDPGPFLPMFLTAWTARCCSSTAEDPRLFRPLGMPTLL